MQPIYRAAPVTRCYSPDKTFPTALEALEYARQAADGFRVGYSVYRVLGGRLTHLWTYRPAPVPAA